jgi:hypothetical protein
VVSRVDRNAAEKTVISNPCQESSSDSLVVQPIAYTLYRLRYLGTKGREYGQVKINHVCKHSSGRTSSFQISVSLCSNRGAF